MEEAGRERLLNTLGIKRFQFYTLWTWGPQVLKNSAQQGDCGKTDKDFTGNWHPTGNGQEEYSKATLNPRTILKRDLHASGLHLLGELSNVQTETCYEKSLFSGPRLF